MLALFPNHVFKNAACVFAEWVQGYEEAQTMNVLIPMHLEMGSGWQGLWQKWAINYQLINTVGEQNDSISSGSVLAIIHNEPILQSAPVFEEWSTGKPEQGTEPQLRVMQVSEHLQ